MAAHDVGHAINPKACAGQIEGGVHMGLGYALSENFTSTNGVPDSLLLRDCGILGAKQTPQIDVILIEVPDEVAGTERREPAKSDWFRRREQWLPRCIPMTESADSICRCRIRRCRTLRSEIAAKKAVMAGQWPSCFGEKRFPPAVSFRHLSCSFRQRQRPGWAEWIGYGLLIPRLNSDTLPRATRAQRHSRH